MSLVSSLNNASDAILGIRAKLGAGLREVYLVTRSWTGRTVGEGDATEVVVKLAPTPGIKELKHAKRTTKDGGAATEGDLTIYHISKKNYPDEDMIYCKSPDRNVEKFYKVGEFFYEPISVTEQYLSWTVVLKRRTDQRSRV